MSYSYKRTETVDTGQMSSTETNYPALFSRTHNDFKSVGNGGHVQNANGYDLNLFADNAGSPGSMLDMETTNYNASTGNVIKFAKVPSISVGQVVWWQYGDSSITTSQDNVAGCWSNGFIAVYHFDDNNGATAYPDSLGTYNLTDSLSTLGFNPKIAPNDASFIAASSTFAYNLSSPVTGYPHGLECWVQPQFLTGSDGVPVAFLNTANAGLYGAAFDTYDFGGNHSIDYYDYNGASSGGIGPVNITANVWTHVFGQSASSSSRELFLNASSQGTDSTALGAYSTTPNNLTVGALRNNNTTRLFFDGYLDELRVHSSTRSSGWVTADYNNQNAPTTFWALGSEIPITSYVPRLALLGVG